MIVNFLHEIDKLNKFTTKLMSFYRYYSLVGKISFFQSKKIIIIFCAVILLYPLPSVAAALYGKIPVQKEQVLRYVAEVTPQFLVLFKNGNCNTFITDFNAVLALGMAIFQISLCYAFGFFYGILIVRKLKTVEHAVSPTTYAVQKQLFIALCFQVLIPLIFLVLPIVLLLMSVLFYSQDYNSYSEIAVQLLALHGSANGISVIAFVRPYRDHFIGKIKDVLRIKPKNPDGTQITIIITSSGVFNNTNKENTEAAEFHTKLFRKLKNFLHI